MRNLRVSAHPRASALSLLLSLGVLVACGKTPPVEQNKVTAVRTQIKDNFKTALENVAEHANLPSAQALQGALTAVLRLAGSESAARGLNARAIKGTIEKLFESELAKAIFADTNITSQTASETVYTMQSAMCEKLGPMAASGAEVLIRGCQNFLASNTVEFRVTHAANNELDLSMWHGALVAGRSQPQLVAGLRVGANLLGGRLNLSGSKELITALIALAPQDPISGSPLLTIKSLAGSMNFELRFKSAQGESGCKDGSALCFVSNVDDDLDVAIEGDPTVNLTFGKSAIDNPSVAISAGTDGSLKGSFNLGALNLNLSKPNIALALEKSAFNVSMTNSHEGIVLMLENFKAGKNPSFFEGFGKKVMLDLTNDSRMIEKIKVLIGAKMLIDLSPFGLVLAYGDESNGQCKTSETIKLATSQNETTQLTFLGPSGLRPYANDVHFFNENCNEGKLLAFPFISMFKVTTEHCDLPISLAVNQGSVELTYGYHLNAGTEQTKVLAANKGQCLKI